jgi:UDP-2,4-diacetamido-2,4,6-trideoxy-beta-L-altropyranose hydrolase
MAAKKIIFRADGNGETGLGHLYRTFALVEIFKDKFDCIFLTRGSSLLNVIPASYHLALIPESVSLNDEPTWISRHYDPGKYQIVADGYQFDAAYQKKIKELNYRLMYIDDLVSGYMHADIVVNHSESVTSADYKAEPYTRFALGARYAILRPSFLEAAKRERVIERIDTVFICFGGADPGNLTCKAAKAALAVKEIKKINIVVGGAFRHAEVSELEKEHPAIKVFRNLPENELIKVMEDSHLAIAPASTILYELCAVKMPVLSGYYVENQKGIYQGCVRRNIVFEGGNFKDYAVEDFENRIRQILAEPGYREKMEAQAGLFDAGIKARFIELMQEITYRKASADDTMLLYDWANDKVSRANSYFTDPIPLETHKNWFAKKLKDSNSLICIAEVDHKPAGMVRYDILETHTVVGTLVAEEFRGRGLAPVFLRETALLYFKDHNLPVWAYIKQQNIASLRSFERAGYKKLREEIVHGHNSFVYKLENNDVR